MICPVRGMTGEERRRAEAHVAALEADGHTVHYPPRDVDQTDDGCGLAICEAHRQAMAGADEVHVMWNPESKGSHFDLGMAFMLARSRIGGLRFRVIGDLAATSHKSYGNVLAKLCGRN